MPTIIIHIFAREGVLFTSNTAVFHTLLVEYYAWSGEIPQALFINIRCSPQYNETTMQKKNTNDIWQQIIRKEKNDDEVMAQLQMRAQEHKLKIMKFSTGNNDDSFMSKYVKSHFKQL